MKRFKTTVAAALTAVALLGSLGFMAACGPEDAAEPAAQAYVSPYDWSGLERSGDRLAFRENGEVRSQLGVDVSDHQGAIDWSAVASDGVDFAFVRVGNRGYTEGALYADTRYAENIDNATSAGLDVTTAPIWAGVPSGSPSTTLPSRTRSSTSPSGSTPTAVPWQASTPPSTSTCCCHPRSKTRPWHVHRFVIHWPLLFARNHEEHARWLVAFSAKSLSRFAIHPCAARSRNA